MRTQREIIDQIKTRIECAVCKKPVDRLSIQEDMILTRTLYFAECHGAEQRVEINWHSAVFVAPNSKIMAFTTN